MGCQSWEWCAAIALTRCCLSSLKGRSLKAVGSHLPGEVLDIGLRAGSWMNLSMGCCLSELGEYVGTRFINTRIWIHFRRVVIYSDKVLWAVDFKGISIKDVSCSNKSQYHQPFGSGPHCGPHLWHKKFFFYLKTRK